MIDTKALREKVLDLAIRGKLVPQDPNDEPASVLLERIRAEKEQMVKEGKLKAKDIKNDTIIFKGDDNLHYEKFQDGTVKCIEDEIPFDVPEGWVWCRLQTFCFPISDGTHQTPTYSESGYTFLSAKNVTSGKIDWKNVMYIPESLHQELHTRIAPQKNDILLAKNGTIGVAAIVDKDIDFDIYVTLALLRVINNAIIPEYLLFAIASSTVQAFFKSSLIGIGVQNLHLEHIRRTPIPIPPYNEQRCIANKVDEIIPHIETISEESENVQTLANQIKSKILDLAIKGKLVPQNPDDEPALVLLERIRAEKEELIKQGKIKRDKKESVIFKGEDNSYYDVIIPQSWEITNLSDVTLNISDGSHNPPPKKNKGVPLLSATNIYDNKINYTSATRWITEDEWIIENARTKIEVGDVLITIVGTIGRTAVVSDTTRFALQRSVAVMKPNMIDSKYLMYVLQAPMIIDWLNANAKGNAQVGIYLKDLAKLSFPLPPLAEQKRIVEAIGTVFSQLDEILNSIS